MEADETAESRTSLRGYNKLAVYGFLCICLKHSLFLIDDAEYDDDHAKVTALNSIYDSLMDLYSCFERVGLQSANVQSMLDLHTTLRGHDPEFNAFDLVTVELEGEFSIECEEPEIESLLPDLPDDLLRAEPAAAFEPHSPEHMALWMIESLTERLGRAMQSGRPSKALRYTEQREVMVRICKFCNENPERRSGVWMMMQNLSDLPSSDDES